MADFRINVIVDPRGAAVGTRAVERRLGSLEARAKQTGRVIASALGFVGVAAGIREIVRLTDAFTNAQNRIRLVTKDTAQLNAVTDELFGIAQRTRLGFEATAKIYSRTALATKNLGLTQRETLNFTESLNQAVILSGASAQEANAGLIQLSQGLASGTLRGDELRSVLEQLPAVADVIAEKMGITRGELRLLGQQGKISAKTVIDAFADAADRLESDFKDTVPTIGQAFTVLQTNIIRFIADVDEATGFSTAFANAVMVLAANLDVVGKAATVAGSFLAIHFARVGIGAAISGIRTLGVVIAANPIGFLLTALSAAIALLVNFRHDIKLSSDGVASLGDLFSELASRVQPFIDVAVKAFSRFTTFLASIFPDIEFSFLGLLRFVTNVQDRIIGTFIGMFNAIVAIFSGLPDAIGRNIVDGINVALETLETFINQIIIASNAISHVTRLPRAGLVDFGQIENNFEGGFGDLGSSALEAFKKGFNQSALSDFLESVIEGAEQRGQTRLAEAAMRAANAASGGGNLDERPEPSNALPFALREQLRLLEEEAKNLQLSNRERSVQNRLLKAEEKLRSSNVSLTDSQRDLLEARIRTNQVLIEQAEVLDSIRGPQEELTTRQEALNALYAQGSIDLGTFKDQMLQLVMAQSELNIAQGQGSFFDGFLIGIEQMLESVRNFSSEAGSIFADFFTQTSEGFADAIGNAIVFGESLEDALGNVARRALADLISGLVKLGLQYVLNAALGETLAATATTAGVAQASALATAFATPAALVSLASYGANAVPAQAGIASTVALTQGLALALADGGLVRGPGGPRSDSVPAFLSNGEFVVNAKSTARFRPQLEAMNNGVAPQGSSASSSPGSAGSFPQGEGGSSQSAGGSTRIVNVLDPNMMEDFVSAPAGEKVIVNVIERNANAINQLLRNS